MSTFRASYTFRKKDFPNSNSNMLTALSQELELPMEEPLPPTTIYTRDDIDSLILHLVDDFSVVLDHFQSSEAILSEVRAAFDRAVQTHYDAMVRSLLLLSDLPLNATVQVFLRSSGNKRAKTLICSLCCATVHIFRFVPIIERLRRGFSRFRRPWRTFWYMPHENFPYSIEVADLHKYPPPLSGVGTVRFFYYV